MKNIGLKKNEGILEGSLGRAWAWFLSNNHFSLTHCCSCFYPTAVHSYSHHCLCLLPLLSPHYLCLPTTVVFHCGPTMHTFCFAPHCPTPMHSAPCHALQCPTLVHFAMHSPAPMCFVLPLHALLHHPMLCTTTLCHHRPVPCTPTLCLPMAHPVPCSAAHTYGLAVPCCALLCRLVPYSLLHHPLPYSTT